MEPMDLCNIRISKLLAVCRIRNVPLNAQTRRINRQNCAIELKLSGKTVFEAENGQIVSDPNHAIFIPKGCSYRWNCMEAGECLVFEFEGDLEGDSICSFALGDNRFLQKTFVNLELRSATESAENRLLNVRDLYAICAFLVSFGKKAYVPTELSQKIRPALDYLAVHYDVPGISNPSLASLCGLSVPYFRKLFAACQNQSPMRYCNAIRMNKAMQLLESDYGSVGQVALSVGFRSIYHFSKEFKQYVGVSPLEYAKSKHSAVP